MNIRCFTRLTMLTMLTLFSLFPSRSADGPACHCNSCAPSLSKHSALVAIKPQKAIHDLVSVELSNTHKHNAMLCLSFGSTHRCTTHHSHRLTHHLTIALSVRVLCVHPTLSPALSRIHSHERLTTRQMDTTRTITELGLGSYPIVTTGACAPVRWLRSREQRITHLNGTHWNARQIE